MNASIQSAYARDPAAFCAGVWATEIERGDAADVDSLELAGQERPYLSGALGGTIHSYMPPGLNISCPRPAWYLKIPKTLRVAPPVGSSPWNSSQFLSVPDIDAPVGCQAVGPTAAACPD